MTRPRAYASTASTRAPAKASAPRRFGHIHAPQCRLVAFLLDRLASKDGNARQPFSPEAAKDGVILKRIEQFGDRFGGFFRLRRAEGFRVVSQGLQANPAIALHVARV